MQDRKISFELRANCDIKIKIGLQTEWTPKWFVLRIVIEFFLLLLGSYVQNHPKTLFLQYCHENEEDRRENWLSGFCGRNFGSITRNEGHPYKS